MQHVTYLQMFWTLLTECSFLSLLMPLILVGGVLSAGIFYYFDSANRSYYYPCLRDMSQLARIAPLAVAVAAIVGVMSFLDPLNVEQHLRVLNCPKTSIIEVCRVDGDLQVLVGYKGTSDEAPSEILGQPVTVKQIERGQGVILSQHVIDGLSRLNYKLAGIPLEQAVKVATQN